MHERVKTIEILTSTIFISGVGLTLQYILAMIFTSSQYSVFSTELNSSDSGVKPRGASSNFSPLSCRSLAAFVLQRHDGRAARVSEVPTPPQTEASAARHR